MTQATLRANQKAKQLVLDWAIERAPKQSLHRPVKGQSILEGKIANEIEPLLFTLERAREEIIMLADAEINKECHPNWIDIELKKFGWKF